MQPWRGASHSGMEAPQPRIRQVQPRFQALEHRLMALNPGLARIERTDGGGPAMAGRHLSANGQFQPWLRSLPPGLRAKKNRDVPAPVAATRVSAHAQSAKSQADSPRSPDLSLIPEIGVHSQRKKSA